MNVKIEEDLCGAQEEMKQQEGQLLDALCKQPRVVLRRADVSEKYLSPEQHEPEPPGVNEELQLQSPNIKKEEQLPQFIKAEGDFTELPVAGVHLKTEDEERQYEEKKGPELPTSSLHVTTEIDDEHCEGSQANSRLAPMSEDDDTISDSPHNRDDNEQMKDVREKYPSPEHHEPELPDVKEEESPGIKGEEQLQCPDIKKEEQLPHYLKAEGDFTELPVTGVHLKTEDEVNKAEPPSSISSQHMKTEIDDEHCGGDVQSAQMLECDDTSHSPHIDDEHSESELTCHIDEKRWQCSHCGKKYVYKGYLERHMISHTGEKPFSCPRFSSKGTSVQHTKTNTVEKPFVCSVCGQRFSRKRILNEHTRTHTGEKPFACSVCGQTFSVKSNLKRHTRTHTGEKPFACLVCGQRFSLRGTLITHTRAHTNEKPFACSICGHSFSTKCNLITHTRTHTGVKPFACSVCGQCFSQKRNLNVHTRTHTGDRPFACLVCDKRFSWKANLKRHTRTHPCEKCLPAQNVTKDFL